MNKFPVVSKNTRYEPIQKKCSLEQLLVCHLPRRTGLTLRGDYRYNKGHIRNVGIECFVGVGFSSKFFIKSFQKAFVGLVEELVYGCDDEVS